MTEGVLKLLEAMGYTLQSGDDVLINFCAGKVTSTIKNDINWTEVPEGLMHIGVSMVLGEFLLAKKTFAPDSIAGLDLEMGIKQLQEGDKNTVFNTDGSETNEQRLDTFINYLLSAGRDEFSSFRRLRWN